MGRIHQSIIKFPRVGFSKGFRTNRLEVFKVMNERWGWRKDFEGGVLPSDPDFTTNVN